MHIGIVVDTRSYGGIESHILGLAKSLVQNQVQVTVIRLNNYGEHPLFKQLDNLNIPYINHIGSISTFLACITKNQFNVLHTHGYKANLYGRLARLFCHISLVSTYHSGDRGKGKLFVYDAIDRLSAWLSHANIAVSLPIQRSLLGQATLLHNAIDTNTALQQPGRVIAFVGRLSEEKAPVRFVDMAIRLPQYQFVMYGDGPLFAALNKKRPSNLTLAGHIDNMATIWPSVNLLIIPSKQEGLPMVSLEAMLRGIPVVSTNVGSMNVVIKDRKNGFLIDHYTPTRCVECIKAWFELTPVQQHAMRTSARQTILDKFNMETYTQRIINIYKNLMNASPTHLLEEQ